MTNPESNIAVSMVALGPKPKISPRAIVNDIRQTWPGIGELSKPETDKKVLSFTIGDNIFAGITLIGTPIPWSDLEGPCATSVLWPGATEVLSNHRAHCLITLMFQTPRTPLAKSRLLTMITASVAHVCEQAVGVYWGNATLVIRPDMFRDFAVEILPHGPPLPIWVDFRVGTNKRGTTSGFTHGLTALGMMELECENATEPPGELRARFEGLIGYLLENGPVIRDGDTIGESMTERIKVDFCPSSFGHDRQVMRLDYSPPEKKKGWFSRG
ncbi:MAG: DUF4261 domain-containing protein [Planctomycetota bacterium]